MNGRYGVKCKRFHNPFGRAFNSKSEDDNAMRPAAISLLRGGWKPWKNVSPCQS